MAELQKNIRRPGGELVSARSPFTRRVLLPTEADLCNALGLTEEEYFQFLENVAADIKKRPEAYNLVPEIVNGPAAGAWALYSGTIGTSTFALTFLGQVAVSVALGVLTYLLTPKPPSMKQGTAERTADIAGLKRFAPQNSFNSVQELANLGDLIPLVFTKRQRLDGQAYGGIRVNAQLMWSQLVSLGNYQQLKLLAFFSLGPIAYLPDLEGYAIGDLLLNNYHQKKVYKQDYGVPVGENIPFLVNGGLLRNDDIWKIDDKTYFSGTRNPTTQAQFGLSNPMPNMTYYKLPYELVRTARDIDTNESRPAGRVTLKKRRKLLGKWPVRGGFISGGDLDQRKGIKEIESGTLLTYEILGSGDLAGDLYDGIGYQQDVRDVLEDEDADKETWNNLTMHPHGVDDINAATKTKRETADANLAENEQYMAGTALVNCYQIDENDDAKTGVPWDGTFRRTYRFEVIEKGHYHASESQSLDNHCTNPNWKVGGAFFSVKPNRSDEDDKFWYEQEINEIYEPCERYALQKVTLGTISNNRDCDITEIGIKSKVYKQIQFANVNSKPEEKDIYDVYDDKSTLTLGQVNKYIARFSFFKLQVKVDGNWVTLGDLRQGTNHTGLFCVRGNTPEFQFNYIRIDHPRGQYEYRFLPWPGNDVIKRIIEVETTSVVPVKVHLLNANNATSYADLEQFSLNGFTVKFAGKKNYALFKDNVSNPEWNLGHPSKTLESTKTISVISFTGENAEHDANYDDASSSNLPTKLPTVTRWIKASNAANGTIIDGVSGPFEGPNGTIIVRFDNYPNPGETSWALYINGIDVTINKEGRKGPEWPQSVKREGNNSHVGVEFHYTQLDGKGGKFEPVLVGGQHPFGNSQWYYVKKTEQYGELAPPVIQDQEVTLVNIDVNNNITDDDNDAAAGLKVNLNVWINLTAAGRVVTDSIVYYYATYSIIDQGNGEYTKGDVVGIPQQTYNDGYGTHVVLPLTRLTLNVDKGQREWSSDIEQELNLYDAASDYWKYEGDQSSHLNGPEHQITYVNEIVKTEGEDAATYEDLAYAALRIDSSKEWTNFSQLSAYFKYGIKVKNLLRGRDEAPEATNLFPNIAYALLTDSRIGAGAVVNTKSVNDAHMEIAARFCNANRFFWDGVISQKINLRSFIFEQGMQCLLDFTIIGGKFSLYPSVPFDENTYEMKLDQEINIRAMFSDGNMSDLQVAFLSPEDRQTFKANVIYRHEVENGFAENVSTIVRLRGEEYNNDPIETYDLTGFCTSLKHAQTFAKFVLATRKFVDHSITFKTSPHFANGILAGNYIRVFSTTQHTQRFNNGAILDNGEVVSKEPLTGNKEFYWWNPSVVEEDLNGNNVSMTVDKATENFSKPLPTRYHGSLFALVETSTKEQCYKVESLTYGEDGLVEISASFAELDVNGRLKMLQDWEGTVDNDGGLFSTMED